MKPGTGKIFLCPISGRSRERLSETAYIRWFFGLKVDAKGQKRGKKR